MSKNVESFGVQEDKPSDWFEPLYASSNKEGEGVPWANMTTHPAFSKWLDKHPLDGTNKSALVVGCGMGDDAIALEQLGFQVTAFDVAETAIKLCKQRFPESGVNFIAADLLKPPSKWSEQFDFVLEIYTVQALPPKYEAELIDNIARFVSEQGSLLVVAEVGDKARSFELGPPWLLTSDHVDKFCKHNLQVSNQFIGEGEEGLGAIGTYVTAFHKPA